MNMVCYLFLAYILLGLGVSLLCKQNETAMYNMTYWELKPYIFWSNKSNAIDGIIPNMYSTVESYCLHKDTFASLISYKSAIKDWTIFSKMFVTEVDTKKYTLWGPFFSPNFLNYSNNKTEVYSLKVITQVSVVVPLDSIKLHSKLIVACSRSLLILLVVGLLCIVFGLTVSIVEQLRNPEGNFNSFSGLWWAFITLTTIGYGDIVPHTLIGRIIAIIWLFVGMVFYSTLTSLLVQTVTGSYVLNDKVIAVFKDSYEEKFAVDAGFEIKSAASYLEVFDLVRDGKADACFINPDVAAWYYDNIKAGDNPLRVTNSLPAHIFVYFYFPTTLDGDRRRLWECFKNYSERFIDQSIKTFNKKAKETNLALYTFSELVNSKLFVYSIVAIGVLISAGLAFDLYVKYVQKLHTSVSNNVEISSPSALLVELEAVKEAILSELENMKLKEEKLSPETSF